jgi:alkaline phosphatase D
MKMKKLYLLFFISVCLLGGCKKENKFNEAQYAPKDAYVNGSKYAYYGSLNPWDRRFFSVESANKYVNRWGQRYFLEVLEGHADKAIDSCIAKLKTDPGDLEAGFVLTAGLCVTNKPYLAFEQMIKTINAGLPFSRFLAGPRSIFEPLYRTKEFKSYYSSNKIELIHGPMLGCVTDSSAKFWVRTRNEIPVGIKVYSTTSGTRKVISSGINKTDSIHGYTTIISVKNLNPDTKYYYDVFPDRKPYYKKDLPYFRTYPVKGSQGKFNIAFGGGAGFAPQNERIWDLMNSYNLSACLLLGDNVYIDMPGIPGPFHDYTYFRRQSRKEFRDLISDTPVYAVWDDHDIATDDIWMGPYINKPAWKLPNFYYYKDQWNDPYYGEKDHPGSWFDFSMGDIDFFVLEGRMYRTNPYDKNPTMLGPVQKKWLFNKLKNSKGTFKVLVSPVGWAPGIKESSKDTWDGFKAEREEIFSFIEKNKIEGVILLSADRHRSDSWKINRKNGYPFYEFMSSKLTNIHTHPTNPNALFSYNKKCTFGLVQFDTKVKDPIVKYTIITNDNEKVYSITVKRSELVFKD